MAISLLLTEDTHLFFRESDREDSPVLSDLPPTVEDEDEDGVDPEPLLKGSYYGLPLLK